MNKDKSAQEPRKKVPANRGQLSNSTAYAFVGSVVPEKREFQTSAYSPAGQMFQREMLTALSESGLKPSAIFSVMPVPSFTHPSHPPIWIAGHEERSSTGAPLKLVGFLNITPIKQVWIGFSILLNLALWGWRERNTRFRLVHSYNLTVPPGLFTLIGARLARAKAVVSLCDINIPGQTAPNTFYARIDYWLHKKLIPKFDGHVVVSDAIIRDFLPGCPALRLEGGITEDFLRGTGARLDARSNSEKSFVIASAGRLDETNGVPIILEAFSQLSGNHWQLRIAGTGPLADQVRQAAARDSRISYLGFISFEEVLKLYRQSDLLVNIRLTEQLRTDYFFPSKFLEYLASGVPVISTATGHVESEFGQFCFVLKDESPAALAAMITSIAGLPLARRTQIGAAARSFMVENKTWHAQAQRLARYIRERVLRSDERKSEK